VTASQVLSPVVADVRPTFVEVAVIDGQPLYRDALERLLAGAEDYGVAVCVASVEEFDAGPRRRPDVVITDPYVGGAPGSTRIRQLAARGLRVLVLSARTDGPVVMSAIADGARGFVSKDAGATEILAAARMVSAGRKYVSPSLASFLLQARRTALPEPELSLREREVLALVARGCTDSKIAEKLYIEVSTVRSHLDRIRDKTGRRRRADLTRFAIEHSIGRS
jgi:DNA-binding NarL/FixJ family response regulator